MRRPFVLLCGLFTLVLIGGLCPAAYADWRALGTGVAADSSGIDGPAEIRHLHVWNDLLIAAGEFGLAGHLPARNIAAWDGSRWSALGDGLYYVKDVITQDGLLTALGKREPLNHTEVVQWDGSQWTHLVDCDAYNHSIASYLGDLYLSGTFDIPSNPLHGPYLACWIERWNGGSSWDTIISTWDDPVSGGGQMLTVLREELYANFGAYGDLISWNGSELTSHGSPQVAYDASIVDLHGVLYVGGWGWVTIPVLRGRPDGSSHWLSYMCEGGFLSSCPVAMTMTAGVESIIVYEGQMVVAGYFLTASGSRSRVVRGDSTTYEGVGSGINDQVFALAEYDGNIVAAGRFTQAGGSLAGRIAEFPKEVSTPVAISHFSGRATRDGAELSWTVVTDELFEGFQIYRSDRGGPYHAVAAVPLPSGARHYTDTDVAPGETYSYYLAALGASNGEVLSAPVEIRIPEARDALYQNHPNPFNPETTIRFELASPGLVRIDVYTTDGRRVRSLVNASYGAGAHVVAWDGRDDGGTPVASGVYYCRMRVGNERFSKKMVLLK